MVQKSRCVSVAIKFALFFFFFPYLLQPSVDPPAALPRPLPPCPGAIESVKHLMGSSAERDAMKANVRTLAAKMATAALPVMDTDSHILPLFVGEADLAKELSARLFREHSIYIQPIFYPSVPQGAARLRCTVSPHHREHHMDAFVSACEGLFAEYGLLKTQQ